MTQATIIIFTQTMPGLESLNYIVHVTKSIGDWAIGAEQGREATLLATLA